MTEQLGEIATEAVGQPSREATRPQTETLPRHTATLKVAV